MEPVRSVLYLDFDNVFGALAKLDPKIAMSFAEQPRVWLRRLAGGGQDESPRRWLVLRCYMNPAGWIPHPENSGARLYFSKFRPALTRIHRRVVEDVVGRLLAGGEGIGGVTERPVCPAFPR